MEVLSLYDKNKRSVDFVDCGDSGVVIDIRVNVYDHFITAYSKEQAKQLGEWLIKASE